MIMVLFLIFILCCGFCLGYCIHILFEIPLWQVALDYRPKYLSWKTWTLREEKEFWEDWHEKRLHDEAYTDDFVKVLKGEK